MRITCSQVYGFETLLPILADLRVKWPELEFELVASNSNLPADTPIKDVAGAIKARWVCEQAHQQLKEELGLDHVEGRSWTGPMAWPMLISIWNETYVKPSHLRQKLCIAISAVIDIFVLSAIYSSQMRCRR